MNERSTPVPVSDATLVRYLDDEADAEERARVEAIAPGTREEARLWELRAADAELTRLLEAVVAGPLPPFRTTRPARRAPWRVAAALALLAAGSAAAMPTTRDALLRGVERAVALLPGGRGGAVEGALSGRATIAFEAPGPTFSVTVRRAQARGDLVLGRAPGGGARAVAPAGAGLTVLPSGLDVDNAAGSVDDVLVDLPAGVSVVTVTVAGRRREVRFDGAVPVRVPLVGEGGGG